MAEDGEAHSPMRDEQEQDEVPIQGEDSRVSLERDKEGLQDGQKWTEIKVPDRGSSEDVQAVEDGEVDTVPPPQSEYQENGIDESPDVEPQRPMTSTTEAPQDPPPPLPEKDHRARAPTPPDTPGSVGPALTNGNSVHTMERSETQSTGATNSTQRSPISSMVFVVTALEQIAASKEARKKKQLGDSATK
ncbi:MAG: hypothetical protein L6R42_007885, partial [Xanthoria sp. 1 TBL-2021]